MERLQELQRSSGRPPVLPPSPRPSYHPGNTTPGTVPAGGAGPPGKRRKRRRSCSQLPWSEYFAERRVVEVPRGRFCVYRTDGGPATVLCLHGGGHSALTWAVFTDELRQRADVAVVALDLRGHGDTRTENETDLSADTLSRDVGAVWEGLYPDNKPPVILMGHSMGGAIAVRVAAGGYVTNIRGVVVIDVVEGSALEALNAMQGVLRRRPQTFTTLPSAIEWALKSGQLRNSESARVSMAGQLRRVSPEDQMTRSDDTHSLREEEEEEVGEEEEVSVVGDCPGYTWRVDLMLSEQYWRGWYEGMSKLFLSLSPPKLLLLAGPDRLDTELTLAHMQGKYQLQMFHHSGHNVQEDVPDKVADVVAAFLGRHQLVAEGGRDKLVAEGQCDQRHVEPAS